MKPADKIQKLINKSDVTTDSEVDKRILGEALEHLEKLKQKKSAATQPNIWRTIMKNRIPKLATAAAVAIVVFGGITFWPSGGSDNGKWWLGPPAAWGQEILAKLDTIKAVTCREQTVLVISDGSRHTSSTWNIFYVSQDSYRRDIYDGDFLREIQWYVPDGEGTLQHSVRYDLKSYFTHSGEGSFGSADPIERMRSFVRQLDKADKLLGEKVVEGRDCVGFEISASKSGDYPEEWIDCIWFDVETKLPVRIEQRGRPVSDHAEETFTIIQYQFDYDPGLSADTFVPRTPEGFIYGHPDEIRAAGWGEYNPRLKLRPGENTISVVVDPGNKVDESDETNNKASRVIPGRQTKHKTESVKVDIAIGDKDLIVTKLSDGLFEAMIPIHNKGSVPLPRFKVYFYAGDPDKGGRLLSTQNAGPIKPGGSWLEGTHPHRLKPGEDTFSVVLDPDNTVEESNETNNKSSQTLSKIVSESEEVVSVGVIRELDLSGDDILQVEAQASKDFNFPYYLFIPTGIDKHNPIYILVAPNNSGMVSDDPGVHQAKALTLVKKSHANKMARRLGVPLLVPTFPRPRPETHSWAYTHALDIDTLEIEEGKLKRVDLQLTAMIKYAQELLRTNGFKINYKVFMHGFSASAKFCNRYSYLHPEMVKAAAAGGVNGLPTLPVREWNGYELPFPIGIAGIEKLTGKPFDERAFRQVAHYIYMGSSDRNDTLFSREAWREEEADIIRKALAAEKMMPDRWEISRKIYLQQKLPAQLVTYNGVGHSIQSQMLDDVIDFFKANTGEKFVRIKPFEYPRRQSKTSGISVDLVVEDVGLSIEENPNGSFHTAILIHNRGSAPSPQFRVNFYAGDPDDGGRLLSEHGAGPIMPGDVWAEGHHGLMLKPGEDTITVVIDPYNKVEESNETNNKVSKAIPGKQ